MQSDLTLTVLSSFVEERQSRLRRAHLLVNEHVSERRVRRWLGRQLVRLGTRLAAEPMHTVRSARAR